MKPGDKRLEPEELVTWDDTLTTRGEEMIYKVVGHTERDLVILRCFHKSGEHQLPQAISIYQRRSIRRLTEEGLRELAMTRFSI